MSVTGKQREVKVSSKFEKYTGFFPGTVVAINPDRDKLDKLLGSEPSENAKDLDYTGEKDGLRTVNITAWLKTPEGQFFPYRMNLTDEVRRNKVGDKIQLINSVGKTTWVAADEDGNFDENMLFEDFKNFTEVVDWKLKSGDISDDYEVGAKPNKIDILGPKDFRPALRGEDELAEFMTAWLSRIDYRQVDANILVDTNKLFAGDFKELTSLIGTSLDSIDEQGNTTPIGFVALAYVRTNEEDPTKQYQQVYRKFLPSFYMKFINNGKKFPKASYEKKFNEFVDEATGDYGIKGGYSLEPLRPYDANMDITASTSTKVENTAVADPTAKRSRKF